MGPEQMVEPDNSNHQHQHEHQHQHQERKPLDSKYIWGLVWQHKPQLLIVAVSSLVAVACTLASPVITGYLFEALAGRQPASLYPKLLALLALQYTMEPLLSKVFISTAISTAERVVHSMRREAFRVLLLQKIEFWDRHNAADMTALLSKELDTVRAFVFSNVSRDRGIRACLESVGAVAILGALSWRLGPALALVVVATAAMAALYRRSTHKVEAVNNRAQRRMNQIADEAFKNIRTVRSFAGEPQERERYESYSRESLEAGLVFARAKGWLEASNRGTIHVSLLLLFALGGWLITHNLLPLRVLLSAIGYTFSLVFATQGVVNSYAELRRAATALSRVQHVLATSSPDSSLNSLLPPGAWWNLANGQGPQGDGTAPAAGNTTVQERASDAAVEAARAGDLKLVQVRFAYPRRPEQVVLKSLELTLHRGSVTALVGRSGAGKSTVAALVSRFYEPQAGQLRLGNQPAESFSRGEWARAVSVVSQEPVLFSGTIAENIAYSCSGHCPQSEIEEAAKVANAHDFIRELPQGYQTIVGPSGQLLSGGQRQRVAIARALLKNSPIIILDEATSALDAVSERLVQDAIERLVQGKTVLVIAHRLSTVQRADRIVVLKDGVVAEDGSHEELVAKGGVYAELVNAQTLTLSTC